MHGMSLPEAVALSRKAVEEETGKREGAVLLQALVVQVFVWLCAGSSPCSCRCGPAFVSPYRLRCSAFLLRVCLCALVDVLLVVVVSVWRRVLWSCE